MKPCRCILYHDNDPNALRSIWSRSFWSRQPSAFLIKEPPVFWYQCSCGRFWLRIGFEGYHTRSFTFYAAHVERDAIDNFNINLIDDIFLASDKIFIGGYDNGDRIEVYKGGFPVDPWYGFRREERQQKAIEFATKAHGTQKYGDKPYLDHLQKVQQVMEHYHIATSNQFVRLAGWLHHVLSATATSKDEMVKNFGEDITDIVCRVSDATGADSEENMNEAYRKIREHIDATGADSEENKHEAYRKVRVHIDATVVLLCDRIAEINSALDNPQIMQAYKAGHPEFKRALYVKEYTFLEDLWGDLNQLLD